MSFMAYSDENVNLNYCKLLAVIVSYLSFVHFMAYFDENVNINYCK